MVRATVTHARARVVLALAGGALLLACAPRTALMAEPKPGGAVSADSSGDRDQDGLTDDVDRCPDDVEDRDGFEDSDGCPDPDNDKDDILDVADRCPNEPRVMGPVCHSDSGCPDDCRPLERVDPHPSGV